MVFVFKVNTEYAKLHKTRSLFIFIAIGLVGLILTGILMHFGVKIFGEKHYLIVKIFVGTIVFLVNYIGRKIFVFKKMGIGK